MTIKSELERNQFEDPLILTTPAVLYDASENEQALLLKGYEIHMRAGIPGLLTELVSEMGPESVNVSYSVAPGQAARGRGRTGLDNPELGLYILHDDGTTSIGMSWLRPRTSTRYALEVFAEPISEALIFQGKRFERIPEPVWNNPNGRVVLEKALVHAYRNPQRRGHPETV